MLVDSRVLFIIMADNSTDTNSLIVESLQLDVQCLQKYREEDKQELSEFRTHVNNNFDSIQKSFDNIQSNFEKLFAAKGIETAEIQEEEQIVEKAGTTPETPNGAASANSVKQAQETGQASGKHILQDMQGNELNLDGTPKSTYRHPNYGQVTKLVPDMRARSTDRKSVV